MPKLLFFEQLQSSDNFEISSIALVMDESVMRMMAPPNLEEREPIFTSEIVIHLWESRSVDEDS